MIKENLEKIVSHLESLIEMNMHDKFCMVNFSDKGNHSDVISTCNSIQDFHTCNTAACVIGHCPNIPGFEPIPSENWMDYSTRITGVYVDPDHPTSPDSNLWRFMFTGDWEGIDNTIEGAITRIRYVIENDGVIDYWDDDCIELFGVKYE